MSYLIIKKEVIIYGFFFLLLISCKKEKQAKFEQTTNYTHVLNTLYKKQLNNCIEVTKKLNKTTEKDSLLYLFKKARIAFKSTEPLMSFFNEATYKNLNRPNLPIVDEDDNAKKVLKPTGFQVLEEEISAEKLNLTEINKHCNNIINTLKLEANNHAIRKLKKHHVLWMIKDSYLRIMALGISGFDSPILQNSLPENKAVINTIQTILVHFKKEFKTESIYTKQLALLENSAKKLINTGFNSFNRYAFIKENINPLVNLINKTTIDWNVSFPFDRKLSNSATSFFNETTFNVHQFSPNYGKVTDSIIKLGEKLFHESKLSKSGKMNCANCHQPKNAFTDGLQFSIANDGSFVKRNSPTLLYSGLQAAQFHDARAASLETQIVGVVENDKEFHNNFEEIINTLTKDSTYVKRFNTAYKKGITSVNIRHAIASYIRTLSKFNSKFDENISSRKNNLTTDEISGFNLFMGKAKCATCHFAPTFNGTVPPSYTESELEVLGIPETIAWKNATINDDLGRYDVFEVDKKKHAFKTPTVRNITNTAPYMHNGVYHNLKEVIKFYNLGGGTGIGINLENQTLPTDKLNLTENEIDQLIAFLGTLSDT